MPRDTDAKAGAPEQAGDAVRPAAAKDGGVARSGKPAKAGKAAGFDYPGHAIAEFPLPSRILYNLALGAVWLFTSLFYPTRFEHGERLLRDLRSKGSVVVGNHVSMVEVVVIVSWLWRHGVPIRPVYKSEFERIGAAKWLFRRVGGIPVDRGTADLKALRSAKEALLRGECVLVYPEGTRIKSDDQPVEVHGGFALMAQMGKAPVVPTAVVGARDPRRARQALRRHPVIDAGTPIEFDELGASGRKARLAAMERVAMERVYALRDALRAANPGTW